MIKILCKFVQDEFDLFTSATGVFTKMNIPKQIQYWIDTAADDLHTAEVLLNNKKVLHALFFCHLCIEKAIKAHIVRCTSKTPVRSHNLQYLIGITDITLTDDEKDFCALLMTYHLEGRYPENYPDTPSLLNAEEILTKTKSLFQCFRKKL
ncbi:MAG: HEPN domain-containing protein [Bacteroidia bacterium]|nr:MAG: HEPN domain-containing protein [Bacteroidia bacterium]